MKDLAIVIPCRNESKNIIHILKKLKNLKVFLINDASTDEIKKKIIHFKNIKLLNNSKRLGYEKSLIKGFSHIKKLNDSKLKYILTMDADGDHDPTYIEKIYTKIKYSKADLVIGNRTKKNRKSEKYISDIFKKKFKFEDPYSGFKIYKKEKLFKTYKKCSKNYFLADLCLLFKKNDMIILNINLPTKKNNFRRPRVNYQTANKKILSIEKLLNNFL